MSMDEQLEQMILFEAQLTTFTNNLRSELDSLRRCHEQVSPYWQDSMRQKYESMWLRFHEYMLEYVNREAPAYLDFLHRKIGHLKEYLNG